MSNHHLLYTNEQEAGCDEAGRGCLAGPVFAAAVILSSDTIIPHLDDSKKLSSNFEDKNLRTIFKISQKKDDNNQYIK